MATAVEFSHVSKFFRLERDKPRAFQDLFISLAQRRKNRKAKEFWALRDVSFGVQKGETLGIIGSNGSGKSTTLKLISRIISPTAGTVRVNGRVTALLELGAGFHPELSGRDNIFMNGTLMGLSRKEIEYKIDSIIEFAELEDFIDVPVKNYSSGMYARLGFSVSVHLDPDILLIDEVLSVGDQSFQQKCNERMLNLRKKGVTILLVSHDIDAIWRLCSRAVWLDHGAMKLEGAASKVTDSYFKYVLEQSAKNEQNEAWAENRMGSGEAYITDVEFLGEEMLPRHVFLTNEALIIRIHYETRERVERPMFGLALHQASSGINLAGPNSRFGDCDIPAIDGKGYLDYHIRQLPLLPGDYVIDASIYDWQDTHRYDYWHQCARFTVVPGGTRERYGVMALEGEWQHVQQSPVSDDRRIIAENKPF